MINDIVLIFAAIYFIGLVSYLPGLLRAIKPNSTILDDSALPRITILVCARNEEKSISACIASIAAQDYPTDKLELIVVNDRSTDRTAELLTTWKATIPYLHIVEVDDTETQAQGKVNALMKGFDIASGEFILMTDADCVVPSKWAKEHVSWYNQDTGMVASITSIVGGNLFDKCHSIEMVQVLALGMSGINYHIRTSIIGNNLSIRKSAYEQIGGYRNVPFSVTEDLALFQKLWDFGWKVKSKANLHCAVVTEPTHDFKGWWRQKQRWVQGGKRIGLPGIIIIGIGFIGAALILLLPFTHSLLFALMMFAIKCVIELLILFPTMKAIGKIPLLRYLILYELYLLCFLLCVPIMYFQRDVKWKDRVYQSQ